MSRRAQIAAAKKLTEANDYDDEDDVTSNVTTASPVPHNNAALPPASPTAKESTIY